MPRAGASKIRCVRHSVSKNLKKLEMINKQEQILVRITGQDRPGLTASIMGILAKYDAQILDIGQADIHSTLSLGILIRMDETNSGQVMKELLFKATELNVNIGFSPITDEEYEDWVGHQGKNRYILMVLGRQLEARQIEGATRILADQGLNIDSILRLTGRKSIKNPGKHIRACIQFSLRGEPINRQEMQSKLMKLSQEMEIDFSFQRDDMFRRMRRLICFDMDSTLIQTECIDELAERNGVGAEVRAITESAMRGEIDFKESFTRRVALLKGLDVSVMQEIAENLPITEGVDRLMTILKRCGYKIAILSGGFTYFGEYLQRRYGIDYVYANELEIGEDGKLTGRKSIKNPTQHSRACIQFSLRGEPMNRQEMQSKLMKLSSEMGIDFSFQRDDMFRRMRRLICFDMDSTLIQTECIDELAERNGVGAQVRAITESAMRGEIDFKESFTRRVALLKGLDVSVMQEIAENLPITEGVDRLMTILKRCGYKIAILSGGFTYFGEYLQRRYGIDYVYANELEIGEDGKLTGRYVGEIVDGHRKAELLKLIAQVEKVNLAQTIAVGDGANDLPMISEAGLGIAFHAKPRVVANAKQSINTIGLDGVLYFLGFKDSYLGDQGKL